MSAAVAGVTAIPGVEGALVVAGGKIALKGALPELIKVPDYPSKVTKIELMHQCHY